MNRKRIKLNFWALLLASVVTMVSCSQKNNNAIPAQIAQLLADHSTYAFEEPMDWQTEILELMQGVYGNEQSTRAVEKVMIDFLLSDASYAAKKMIWMDFANIVSDQSVPSLVRMLEGEMTAQLAMLIIQKAGLEDRTVLANQLSRVADSTKIGIINHFGSNREEDAVDLLYGFTQDENQLITTSAFSALGKIGTMEAAERLESAFGRLVGPVGIAIHDTMLQCAEQLAIRGHDVQAVKLYETQLDPDFPLSTKAAALYGLFRLNDDPVEFVRRKLETVDPDLRPDIIRMVRNLPVSFRDGDALLRTEGLNAENRIQLLLILASRKDRSIRPYVLNTLEGDDPIAREAALTALRSMATADDVDKLLKFAIGAERKEKDRALLALHAISGQDVDEKLIRNLHNASPEKLLVLLEIARERGISTLTNRLLELCQHEDSKVRVEAIRTLGAIGVYDAIDKALKLLMDSGSNTQRRAWEKTVYQLALKIPVGTKRFAEVISQLEQVEDKANVSSLIVILGENKNPADYRLIRKYLENSVTDIQISAIRAVSEWPNSDPRDDLIDTFRDSNDQSIRTLALKGALQLLDADRGLSNADKIELLRQWMQETRNSSEKTLVISGYGEIATMDSLQVLVSLMKNSEYTLEVEASIKRILRNVYIADPEQAREEILKAKAVSSSKEFQDWIEDGLRRERFDD